MKDKSQERVMVVPTAVFHQLGVFQGLSDRGDEYVSSLLLPEHISYRPRAEVETDPSYKQIVPYVVLRWRDQVFHYTRGKRGTEIRLQALRSVGVGGHINESDVGLFQNPFREAMLREVAEEVELDADYDDHCLGLINDDSTPVGQVHLGIAYVFDLTQPHVRRREQAIARSGFASISELKAARAEFETWSQWVLDAIT